MRSTLIALVAGLGLSGCAPTLTGANEFGGTIKMASDVNSSTTFSLAEASCAKYGKHAKMTGGDLVFAKVARFDCV